MLTIGDNTQTPGVIPSTFTPDDLVASQQNLVLQPITLGAGALVRGTVLGLQGASADTETDGIYVLCIRTAVDGSQTPIAILADDADATAAPVVASAYVSGEFDTSRLIYDPSWTPELLTTSFRAGSIFLRTTPSSLTAADPA